MYTVFVRNWWRKDARGNLVPNSGGRRTILARNVSEDEARAMCKDWNATHKPGQLSRKAEYIS